MKDVEGKVAFITGGDSGIGLGIARAFVDAGMKIVITYRTKSHLDEAMELLKPAGDRVHAVNLDVTDRAGFEKAAVETIDKFKKVHVVVNNAGVGVIGGISTATFDDWDWGMRRECERRVQRHSHVPAAHSVARGRRRGHRDFVARGAAWAWSCGRLHRVEVRCRGDDGGAALRASCQPSQHRRERVLPGIVNTNIGKSARNRPSDLVGSGFKPDPKMLANAPKEVRENRGPSPADGCCQAGQRACWHA